MDSNKIFIPEICIIIIRISPVFLKCNILNLILTCHLTFKHLKSYIYMIFKCKINSENDEPYVLGKLEKV